jgi:broad specificity phosphatase PhoE
MAIIYLVRHGKAAAGFGDHADPGLDPEGEGQAAATARALEASHLPMPIYSSPLARARETALPLAAHWHQQILIEPRVAEIPSPTADLGARSAWLRKAMAGRWSDLDATLQRWRQDLLTCVLTMPEDSVVFCHYIAINVVVGATLGDDRLVVFTPDHASITTIRTDSGKPELISLGKSGHTHVN